MNTTTLRTPEKLLELESAVQEINWDIIGLSEVRRTGESIEDYKDYILYYKGQTPGMYGVGFMIKKHLVDKIEEFVGISERIAILNIKLASHKDKWSIIQVYAPTEQATKEKTDSFYEDLQNAIQKAHKKVIVMGDFNGKIGEQLPGEEHIIGKHGYGKRSKNGDRLISFALENKLAILNSFFKKKKSKKWTWISPNGLYTNEIDFILTNNPKIFKDNNVLNNLNFNTNHRMVRAVLGENAQKKTRKHYGKHVAIIQEENKDILISNLEQALHSEEENIPIQEKYDRFILKLKNETNKINANTKRNKISEKTKHLLLQRKDLLKNKRDKEKFKLIAEISKKINEQIRKDRKSNRLNTIRLHIEKTGGIKKALKELKVKTDWIPSIRNKSGINITKRPEIIQIATNFYRNLYHSNNTNTLIKLKDDQEMAVPPILIDETKKAIRTQKQDKAPGPDQINNELIKSTIPVIAPKLTELFNEILRTEYIPTEWTKSVITLIHKKGDKDDIANYRPISLMSNIYKIFSKVLLSRITIVLEENQPKEQAGFRSDFSTLDHIHVVKQILQKYKEFNKTYYLGFVDYSKAFDSLEHNMIWQAIKSQGVENKYIRILRNIYSQSSAQVQLERISEEFPINKGVRQGDPISPKLFSAVLETIFRNLDWDEYGLNINGEKLNHLRFADDLVLFSECPKTLQKMLQQLADESMKAGLSMNTSKTMVMSNSPTKTEIYVNDKQLKYVDEYIYLGQVIATNDCMSKEIQRRVTNAWKRYWSLKEVMKSKDIPIREKRKVFNVCILPCLTYGCQTWALTKNNLKKLKVCQNNMARSIIGIKLKDKVRLEEIKKIINLTDIETVIKQLKWRWAGHMMRSTKDKWTKTITDWYPRDSGRNKGRQIKRWEDDIKKIAGPLWPRKAKDRKVWNSLEEAYVKRQAD